MLAIIVTRGSNFTYDVVMRTVDVCMLVTVTVATASSAATATFAGTVARREEHALAAALLLFRHESEVYGLELHGLLAAVELEMNKATIAARQYEFSILVGCMAVVKLNARAVFWKDTKRKCATMNEVLTCRQTPPN